jgi:hypothetical protein
VRALNALGGYMSAVAAISRVSLGSLTLAGAEFWGRKHWIQGRHFTGLHMSDFDAPGDFEKHRDYLYRYALQRLRDASRADDVVQETLLAAVESGGIFAGGSSLKTWLSGILKHKITDLFRRQSRETPVPAAAEGEDEREFADQLFDHARADHWHTFPQTWEDPERSFEQ